MPQLFDTCPDRVDETADEVLVQRAKAGDNAPYNILRRRHSRLVYGIGWSITGRSADADDVVQDTFVSAFSRLGTLSDGRKFSAWIGQIARNASYDVLARRKRHRISDEWLRNRDMADTPKEKSEAFHSLNHLWFAVKELGADDRATLVLHYLVGLDQQSVANALQIPLGTVKSRLNRVRRNLKGKMIYMKNAEFSEMGLEDDFGRSGLGGMKGDIVWQALLKGEGTDGWREIDVPLDSSSALERRTLWSRRGNSILGRAPKGTASRLVAGDTSWRDYEVSTLLTLVEGPNMQLQFRVSQDGKAYYLLDFLYGWQAVAISKMEPDARAVEKLSVVNFPFVRGREYNVLIAARERSLTSYIDGKLINQVTDRSFREGGIAMCLWSSTVNSRDPRIRHFH